MKGISKDEEVGGNGRFCQVSLNMNKVEGHNTSALNPLLPLSLLHCPLRSLSHALISCVVRTAEHMLEIIRMKIMKDRDPKVQCTHQTRTRMQEGRFFTAFRYESHQLTVSEDYYAQPNGLPALQHH